MHPTIASRDSVEIMMTRTRNARSTWNRYGRPILVAPKGKEAQQRHRDQYDRNPERTELDQAAEGPMEHLSRYLLARRIVPGLRVLDGGCGYGYGSILVSEWGARSVVGVDLDGSAFGPARELLESAERAQLRVSFCSADLRCLPFHDNTCDVFIAFEVLEHLTDPDRFLAEAHRVLTDAGVLLLSTPNRNEVSPGWILPPNRHHVREYDPEELSQLLHRFFPDAEMAGQIPGPALTKKRMQGRVGRRLAVAVEKRTGLDPRTLLPATFRRIMKRTLGERAVGKEPMAVNPSTESLQSRMEAWIGRGRHESGTDLGGLYRYGHAADGEILIAACHKTPGRETLLS